MASMRVLAEYFEKTLPVEEARGEFEEALSSGRPVVVVAPTGSGKSTRLPLWLADGSGGPVLVVEPRRVACRSLATYLAGVIGEEVGRTVGYRVRFEDRTSPSTKVIFATTGVALRMVAGGGMRKFSAVLLDEFHERGWEVDLLVAALVEERRRREEPAALVLTSATVDAAGVAGSISAEVVEAKGRSYPVDIAYREGVAAPSREGLDRRVYSAVEELLGEEEGDLLVFLPGKGEIADCESTLQPLAKRFGVELVGVHGGLPTEFLARAFGEGDRRRRVFLSTNVAETSLTLPGVTAVVDSGLARMRIHRGGRSALALVPISMASMDQRAGRAGRVAPGRCLRLWSRRFRPEEETRPEIERIELDDFLLQAAICGLDGARFEEATWIRVPPEFAVEKARRRLERMGAFDEKWRITKKGRRMAALPVGGDEARILLDPPEDVAATAADLVALLQLGRDLLLPRQLVRGRAFEGVLEARGELLAGVADEVYVQLRCLRAGEAGRHGLHGAALKEARRIAKSLRRELGVKEVDPWRDKGALVGRERLVKYLLTRIPEAAFVVRKRALKRRVEGKGRRGKSEPWGNGEIELAIWPFEVPVREQAGAKEGDPVAGLVLDHFWLGDAGTGVRGTGRMVLPCGYDALLEGGIGEEEIREVRAGHHGGVPKLRAKVRVIHGGVELSSEERELRGRALCREAARAILEGRILRPLGEEVLDDLHVWDLMARWPERDRGWEGGEVPPKAQEYLAERLEALGVRLDEDLMLLEGEDLRPSLPEVVGAYRFDVEKMAEEFPRIWEYRGFRYRCRIRPVAREVILEPVDKKTARAKDPVARLVPRFRGFDVYYKNASRSVPIR